MADELLRSKHGFGTSAGIEVAKIAGKLDQYDILFLDGATDPKIGWIDKDGNTVIVDHRDIFVVDELPASGKDGKLYIVGSKAYIWVAGTFVALGGDVEGVTEEIVRFIVSEEIEKSREEILEETKAYSDEKLEEFKGYADEKVEETKVYADEKSDEAKAHANEKVEELAEESKASFEKIKFEITGTPDGTLVKMSDSEIRVMCPEDAVFTKQSVGAGGDANNYYMTFKTYAPDEAVGYIEHLGDQVDPEVLTDLKTDGYGRKYQPTWLALARYDEATGIWTYYGANSTVEKYIGWNYQIDWYNADGVMIGSDSVRINLSNESCHSKIEPYYIPSFDAKMEESIAESKAYTDEQVAALLSAFTVVEF